MPRYGLTLHTLIDWYFNQHGHHLGLRVVARVALQASRVERSQLTTRRQSSRSSTCTAWDLRHVSALSTVS